MTMIDATRKFARRTAAWLIKSKMPTGVVADRLSMFPEDHVKMVGEEASTIKGGKRRVPPPPPDKGK